MAKDDGKRLVDIFAGKGSTADKLRKRRIAVEAGDPSGGVNPPESIPEEQRPKGSKRYSNNEIRRGFRKL